MGKLRNVGSVFRIMLSTVKEEWDGMDKKLYRVVFGILGFAAMGLFWFYVIRNITPFGF